MKLRAIAPITLILLVGIGFAACKTSPGNYDSVLKDEQSEQEEAELQQAKAALALIMEKEPRPSHAEELINRCDGACHWHGTDADQVKLWGDASINLNKCFEANNGDAKKQIECMLTNPSDDESWLGKRMGFHRGAVRTSYFEEMFRSAYGEEDYGPKYEKFVKKMQMPSTGHQDELNPFDDAQWAQFSGWVFGGMKKRVEAFGGNSNGPNATNCEDYIAEDAREHIKLMEFTGWKWKNAFENPIDMYACSGRPSNAQDKRFPIDNCFRKPVAGKSFPMAHRAKNSDGEYFARTWAELYDTNGWPIKQRMRILRELDFQTFYWVRSSADGRFVASGLRSGSGGPSVPSGAQGVIADLAVEGEGENIGINAPYDPGFFPDNAGFTYISGGSAWFCNQELLSKEDRPNNITIQDHPNYCAERDDMRVYQHVGRLPDGGDYYVVRSDNYANDDGAYSVTNDPRVNKFFKDDAILQVYPMRTESTSFSVADPIELTVPWQGDWGISPNGGFLTARIATKKPEEESPSQLGYALHMLNDPKDASAGVREVARMCIKGGKATMSFNDRVFVTHHYVDDSDWQELGYANPEAEDQDAAHQASVEQFKKLVGTSANIWYYDMLTGERVRITRMQEGQFALYPHFRSDGWLYFVVRDTNDKRDYVVATDVALRTMYPEGAPQN